VVPPDDAVEVRKRGEGLKFLRGVEVKGALEDAVSCYLSAF